MRVGNRVRQAVAKAVQAPTRGFVDQQDLTNDEIAVALGITRQAVSQTVQSALLKLRRELTRRGVLASDLF